MRGSSLPLQGDGASLFSTSSNSKKVTGRGKKIRLQGGKKRSGTVIVASDLWLDIIICTGLVNSSLFVLSKLIDRLQR